MGIPSYFSYILKNHKKIIKHVNKYNKQIDNLYEKYPPFFNC